LGSLAENATSRPITELNQLHSDGSPAHSKFELLGREFSPTNSDNLAGLSTEKLC